MAKSWKNMDTDEKLEALRLDIETLFNVTNDINRRIPRLAEHTGQVEAIAKAASKEVAALKEKLKTEGA